MLLGSQLYLQRPSCSRLLQVICLVARAVPQPGVVAQSAVCSQSNPIGTEPDMVEWQLSTLAGQCLRKTLILDIIKRAQL